MQNLFCFLSKAVTIGLRNHLSLYAKYAGDIQLCFHYEYKNIWIIYKIRFSKGKMLENISLLYWILRITCLPWYGYLPCLCKVISQHTTLLWVKLFKGIQLFLIIAYFLDMCQVSEIKLSSIKKLKIIYISKKILAVCLTFIKKIECKS